MSSLHFSAIGLVLVFLGVACGDDAALSEVRAGNLATLASLQTLQCEISIADPVMPEGFPARPPRSGKYWWAEGMSRWETHGAEGTLISVQRGGVTETISQRVTNGRQSPVSFRRRSHKPGEPHRPFDAWELGILRLCGPQAFPRTFEELVEGAGTVENVERRSADGRAGIVVAFRVQVTSDLVGDFEFTFDPAFNYLARQRVATFPGDKRRETKVQRFRECAPTLYFPEYVETHHWHSETLIHHEIVEFKNVRINEPISPEWFTLVPPAGAYVRDQIANSEYEVRQDGSIGSEKELFQPAPLPQSNRTYVAPTSAEESGSTWWVLTLCSAAILVIGVGIWLYRRR